MMIEKKRRDTEENYNNDKVEHIQKNIEKE